VLKAIEHDPLVGTRLADRYEIVSVIGRGGMGVVYKARQEVMDRLMAIKMLHSHMVSEPESVKRFYREAKTISQVRHHNVITLYDFGMSTKGQPYIVMDYLEGSSLKQLVKENGPLQYERGRHIFRQVIEALAAAHGLDVVHRDLKPENIMLTKQNGDQDWVTLVDFGLSKLKDIKLKENFHITRGGDVCGSPPYMSPEQCLSSLVVDPRSDIYSLAVVIYEALSGKLPFDVKSAIEMIDRHLYSTPIPFNQISPALKVCTETTRVLAKALEKGPEKRQQTIEEFGAELHEAMMRDSLKLRALRHRVEVLTLQGSKNDLAYDENFPPDKTKTKDIAEVIDGAQFWAQQADIEQDSQTKSVGNPVANNGNDTKDVNSEDIDCCPYCETPLNRNFKFCLNCQRTTTSRQIATKSTKWTKARARFGQTKILGLSTIVMALQLMITVATIYALYAGFSNGIIIDSLKKVTKTLHVSARQLQ